MDRLPVNPSWRKLAGMFAILLLIGAWSILVVTVAEHVAGAPWPLQALYFLVAGIAWVLPLKPLLRWMETGSSRRRRSGSDRGKWRE